MAYDPSTFIYKGDLTDRVLDMIAAGSIIDLDLKLYKSWNGKTVGRDTEK